MKEPSPWALVSLGCEMRGGRACSEVGVRRAGRTGHGMEVGDLDKGWDLRLKSREQGCGGEGRGGRVEESLGQE